MFVPSNKTLALLADIESRIDPEVEEHFLAQWRGFLNGQFDGDIFWPQRTHTSQPGEALPEININDALADYDLMLQRELAGVSHALSTPCHNLCVRANYGTGILSSVFGAQIFRMPYATNTLPTTHPFDTPARIAEIIAAGIPDLDTGFGKQVFEMGEIFAKVFAKYPKISKYVTLYHPDLQGPLDIAELLWGSDMFYAMYDEPEQVHALLALITDTYTAFMQRWERICPLREDMNPHWANVWHRGKLMLRNDSAMNISPEMYSEFAAPYDGLLLARFGGGAVHFCGRGDHYIDRLCALPGLFGINLSQPEYNDMEKIYQNSVDKGICILGFHPTRAKQDVTRPGGFGHRLSI